MRIRVTFETELPDFLGLTEDEVRDWIKYKLGAEAWTRTNSSLLQVGLHADQSSIEIEVNNG